MASVGSMVKWLECRNCYQHGFGLKPTPAILFCLWKRYFIVLSPAWWSWQAVLNFSDISIKFQADSKSWHFQKQVGVIAYPMY